MSAVVAPVIGILPAAWREIAAPPFLRGVRAFDHAFGLRVLVGVENRGSATGVWLHVSTSRVSKLPSWSDLREVKDLFIGRDRIAIQLLPPEQHYVNLHQFTLHLWSRLDGPTVPPRLYEDQ